MLLSHIIDKIRLSIKSELGREVKDVDVANALGMSKAHFSKIQKQEIVPYKNIVTYCGKKKINLNWIFFDQDLDTIAENSEKLIKIRYK